jgi:V8-like Glu-specific endopeptidase
MQVRRLSRTLALVAAAGLGSLPVHVALAQIEATPRASGQAVTQPDPLASRDAYFDVDSGIVRNDAPAGSGPAVVFSTVVATDDSDWLRLAFDTVKLAGSREGGDASFIRITSLTDGAHQNLDNVSILQWKLTTAYFNGDALQIDVVAYPGTGDNQIVLTKGVASLPVSSRSICGTTDDRVLSFDDRSARILPIGCTGWTISDCNHCMLTAGHCMGGISTIQFKVPLSTSGGGIVNPHPDHQYATDTTSLQGNNGGSGVGDDWAYYGVFPNSNTGLTPFEAYGVAHNLDITPPSAGGNARVTGYGSTSSPVSPTWYLVQKTHAGPYVSFSGTALGYAMDTTGGNSGSPVIHEATNTAIGIHTHGGCGSGGGNNWGTGANHPSLVAALNDPKGVCECPGPELSSGPLPEYVSPAGGDTVSVTATPVAGISAVSGSGLLHIDEGAGYYTIAMTDNGAGEFLATFPDMDCPTSFQYYFSIVGTDGRTFTLPDDAPGASFAAIAAYGVTELVALDFETNDGWTVENVSVSAGAWERGVPIGGGLDRDPATDFDGSGACWLTGNAAGSSDVDGGPTRLVTRAYDLSGSLDPVVSYARWHNTNDSSFDRFIVEISNNNGSTWTTVSNTGSSGAAWNVVSFHVTDYVTVSSTVKVRFSVKDAPNNSTTESAVDAFRIFDYDCTGCPTDLNGDTESDILDFLDFIDSFGACENQPAPCSGSSGVDADYNGDTTVDVLDFLDFLDAFGTGC